jgi:dynein heavy chain 1
MGSREGLSLADSAISQGVKTGNWVLIRNAHLAIPWLISLQKKLNTSIHQEFRLFISIEINDGIPIGLLRQSRILTFEPSTGIRSAMLDSLQAIPENVLTNGPVEKNKVLFMMSWIHSVILERLRYLPIGWTKPFDFNDSDFEMSVSLIDNWLQKSAKGRTNLSPERIPWDALQSLIVKTVYGGKIDSEIDFEILKELVCEYLSPHMFDKEFSLVNTTSYTLRIPESNDFNSLMAWTRSLADFEPPSWLSIPNRCDLLIKESAGTSKLM